MSDLYELMRGAAAEYPEEHLAESMLNFADQVDALMKELAEAKQFCYNADAVSEKEAARAIQLECELENLRAKVRVLQRKYILLHSQGRGPETVKTHHVMYDVVELGYFYTDTEPPTGPATPAERSAVAERCPLLAMYDVQSHSFDDEAAQNRKRGEVVRAVRDYVNAKMSVTPTPGAFLKLEPKLQTKDFNICRAALVRVIEMLKEGE